MKNKFEQSLENAIDCFWQSIASSYPEIKTGDMAPEYVAAFEEASREAINHWLWANVEDKAHTTDEQCQRYVNDGCCPVCNVGHGEGCPVCQGTGYHTPGCSESDAEGSVQENQQPDDAREDWRYEVSNGDTDLGFEDWKAKRS